MRDDAVRRRRVDAGGRARGPVAAEAVILFVLAAAAAPQPPITEIDHPRYVDAAGEPVSWSEVRTLAAGTGALGQVRRRRIRADRPPDHVRRSDRG